MSFKNIFNSKKAHFYEGSSRPNVEKILILLNEEKILNISFNLSEWRSNTDIIIKQLRDIYNDLKKDSYLDMELTFILSIKEKLDIENKFEKNIFINDLFLNGIDDSYKKIIKKIYKYNNINEHIESILQTTIYNSLHLQEHNIYLENSDILLNTYRNLVSFIEKINRINRFIKEDLLEAIGMVKGGNSRILLSGSINRDNIDEDLVEQIDKYINKIEESSNLIDILGIIDELNKIEYISKNRYFRRAYSRLYQLFFRKRILNKKYEKNDLIDLFNEEIINLNQQLSGIKKTDIETELDKLLNNKNINFYIKLSEFIPAFISRIDIIEEGEKKKTFIEKFEIRKNYKKRLSALYLFLSISIFGLIIYFNYIVFLENINSTKTLVEFTNVFLGRNIYLFSVEFLLMILGFYFLGLFKTYSKVVELYDSHILLIESDFYYKDDKDLNVYNFATFELRKENTQKIHNLPDKTYNILNGKNEIKTELPTVKILENIGKILNSLVEKISSKK